MAGFRYCKWCDGKGCVCCNTEQKNFTINALAAAPSWRLPGDIRDVRDATVKAEQERAIRGLDALTEDEVNEVFKPSLDAEYARQFPDGPKPIMTLKIDGPLAEDRLSEMVRAAIKEMGL